MKIIGTDLENELTTRAIATYTRDGGEQPASTSGIVEHDGRSFVVLRNMRGALASYRISDDGTRITRDDAAADAEVAEALEEG